MPAARKALGEEEQVSQTGQHPDREVLRLITTSPTMVPSDGSGFDALADDAGGYEEAGRGIR